MKELCRDKNEKRTEDGGVQEEILLADKRWEVKKMVLE